MAKKLCILGSTGSIGVQALDVVRCLQGTEDEYEVTALTANRQVKAMEEQIRAFHPPVAVMFDESAANELRTRVSDLPVQILSGMEGLLEVVSRPDVDVVLNSVVGMVGLRPTLAAIAAKKTIALANKETLVVGGALVTAAAKANGVSIYPVDSEHSAIFQCLQGCCRQQDLQKLILTASGGPFFGKSRDELADVTPAMALKHPNWSMGAKITIDSATMMNKGWEVIEAKWLFDVSADDINVVVHPQSVIHSMVEFEDGAVLAQMGCPDMRQPIQYALAYPSRLDLSNEKLDFAALGSLTFEKPDMERFPCLALAFDAIRTGGNMPCIANAANEEAVAAFLAGKIAFYDIPAVIEKCMGRVSFLQSPSLDDIYTTNEQTRALAASMIEKW